MSGFFDQYFFFPYAFEQLANVTVPAIEVEKLTVTYDAQPVLWDIDLTIPQRVVMGLVGPNGAGKSTLLKSILDLTPKLAGTIKVLGQPFASNLSLIHI